MEGTRNGKTINPSVRASACQSPQRLQTHYLRYYIPHWK